MALHCPSKRVIMAKPCEVRSTLSGKTGKPKGRALNMIPIKNPMSIFKMALLPIILNVAHVVDLVLQTEI